MDVVDKIIKAAAGATSRGDESQHLDRLFSLKKGAIGRNTLARRSIYEDLTELNSVMIILL